MRFKLPIACLLAALIIPFISVSASDRDRPMRQTYSIEITVECLETAIETMRMLAGHDLLSEIYFADPNARWAEHRAYYTRRVENWAFRHVQAALRDMGEVTFESENTQHLGAQLADTETRLAVLGQELDRLAIMMAASNSLEVLMAIDHQLSRVSNERDRLTGRRNTLINDAQHATISIWLTERTEYVPPAERTFGQRVADSFLGSWHGTLRIGGNLAVFFARVSIPLIIWAALGAAAIFVAVKKVKKHKSAKAAIKGEVHDA